MYCRESSERFDSLFFVFTKKKKRYTTCISLPLERREKMSTEKLKVKYVVERQSLNAYISY